MRDVGDNQRDHHANRRGANSVEYLGQDDRHLAIMDRQQQATERERHEARRTMNHAYLVDTYTYQGYCVYERVLSTLPFRVAARNAIV